MKIKKRVIIPIVAVLVVAIGAGSAIAVNGSKPEVKVVDTYTVENMDLANTVSVTGMVESDDTTSVYTTLTYPIMDVPVEVGDIVSEGDVLCVMDVEELEKSIALKQASASAAQAKANYNLKIAEKDQETAKFNVEGEYNTSLLNAESAVKTAENALRSAQHKASAAQEDLRDIRDDKKQADDDESYDDMIKAARQTAVTSEIAVEGAQQALEDAQASLRAIKMKTKEEQIIADDGVTTAKLGTNFNDQWLTIEQLQQELADATVTAPVSGTVTAVYAKKGAIGATSGGGLLFVIEDMNKLKVTTNVKEYDIASVTEGLPVTIKSDGTGDEEFKGVVSKIAPTTAKDTSGKNVEDTNAEFETQIQVIGSSKLRIGMNARLNIITEEKKDVLAIPYEAVTTNEAGESIVYIMVEAEDGTATAKAVPITTGMETDFSTEITSDELKSGDIVITTPEGITDGILVSKLDEAAIEQAIMA